MRHFYLITVLLVLIFTWGSALGDSGLPWVGWIQESSIEEASLVIVPDGSGPPLTEAMVFGGDLVDATIEIGLVDMDGYAVVDFPAEDMWLGTETDNCTSCAGGYHAGFPFDVNTDNDGVTYIANPLPGGGWTEGPVWVFLNGQRATSPFTGELAPVQLRLNSPDINNDGEVNLADVTLFAENYFGQYSYRSDYFWDGVVNLADVAIMASGLGTSCE